MPDTPASTELPAPSGPPAPTILSTEEFHHSVLALPPRTAVFDCDGTLWDGLHTALRGRVKHAERETSGTRETNGTNGTNGADLPTKRLTPPTPQVHDLPTKRFSPVRRE